MKFMILGRLNFEPPLLACTENEMSLMRFMAIQLCSLYPAYKWTYEEFSETQPHHTKTADSCIHVLLWNAKYTSAYKTCFREFHPHSCLSNGTKVKTIKPLTQGVDCEPWSCSKYGEWSRN